MTLVADLVATSTTIADREVPYQEGRDIGLVAMHEADLAGANDKAISTAGGVPVAAL